jgi:hypothetical protein
MEHDFDKTADYVMLMLGAPAVDILLNKIEIIECVETTANFIIDNIQDINLFNSNYLENKLREGALALATYAKGKKKFFNSHEKNINPEKDGWDLMCRGSGEWDEFKQSIVE